MSIFDHAHFTDPRIVNDNPHSSTCLYCQSKLNVLDLEDLDLWPEMDDDYLLTIHSRNVAEFEHMCTLPSYHVSLRMDTKHEYVYLSYCTACGWWRVIKVACICAEKWQVWDMFFGFSGTLKSLDLTDLKLPLDEVSNYLVAKYESRFSVHPRLFEEVVASVFKSIGHDVLVTGYSNDGGIDVILGRKEGAQVGIQVKRYKNKIKVEQIRAFAGAMLLGNMTKGIFVTTSDFQPAAVAAAEKFRTRTLPIQLVNSEEFYEALKISTRPKIDLDSVIDSLKKNPAQLIEYGWETPQASL